MIARELFVKDCEHTHFDFEHFPGHGYRVKCPECGVVGGQHPIAGEAMKSFERTVTKCRAAERRKGEPAVMSMRTSSK